MAAMTPCRAPRRTLAVLLVVAVALATGCHDGGGSHATLVSTADLWASPATYEGRAVRTTGVAIGFNVGAADEHHVVEGERRHRVALRGVDPARLAAIDGRSVTVIGRFHFSEAAGFTIDVETISAVG